MYNAVVYYIIAHIYVLYRLLIYVTIRILAFVYIIYSTDILYTVSSHLFILYIPPGYGIYRIFAPFLLYQYHNFSSHLLMSIYRMLADVYIIYFKLAFSYVIYCILAPFFVIYRILAPVYICHKTLSCCCSNRCCS